MLLALDVSTSVIGWSLWKDDKLHDQGFLTLADYKGNPKELADRLDVAVAFFSDFKDVTKIAAEEALQKFSGGKTNAQTMNKLIAMNFGLTYTLSRLWKVEVDYIPVVTARKLAGIVVPRQAKGQKKDPNWAKKFVISEILKIYPSLNIGFTNQGNPRKGHDDLADSIVIGIAAGKR